MSADMYDVLMLLLYLAICAGCALIGWIGGSVAPIRIVKDFFDGLDREEEKDCGSCRWYLGGGACRMNLEDECGEDRHQAWEARR